MAYWLKLVGASDWECQEHPFEENPELKDRVRFPKNRFPGNSMKKGDSLVYYAVGWTRIFAVVDVVEPPERDVPTPGGGADERWPHAVRVIRTEAWLDDLTKAPLLRDIAPSLLGEIDQGTSHLPMSPSQFNAARQAIRRARI